MSELFAELDPLPDSPGDPPETPCVFGVGALGAGGEAEPLLGGSPRPAVHIRITPGGL